MGDINERELHDLNAALIKIEMTLDALEGDKLKDGAQKALFMKHSRHGLQLLREYFSSKLANAKDGPRVTLEHGN